MGKALKVKRAIIFGGNLSEINPEICAKINIFTSLIQLHIQHALYLETCQKV